MSTQEDKSANGSKGKQGRLRSSLRSTQSWRLQFAVVGVLLAGLVVFFTVYVSSRRDTLIERNFGLLGNMSSQTSEALENLHLALANALKTLTNFSTPDAFTNAVSQIVPHVDLDWNVGIIGSGPVAVSGIDYPQEGRTRRFAMTYHTAPDGSDVFTGRVDLAELLRPILNRYDFADVLLAEANGTVVFQLSQSEERPTNPMASADLRISRLPGLEPASGTNLTIRGTCLLEKIELAGTQYKLFAQPLKVSLGEDPKARIDWWICGLVRGRDFTLATWQIPATTTVAFIFIALGLLIVWPFLNISGADATSGISRLEVIWILAGSFLGCAALTLLVLCSNAYLVSEKESDEELELLAAQIHRNVVSEFERIDQSLTRLDDQLAKEAQKAATNTTSDPWAPVKLKVAAFSTPEDVSNLYSGILEVFWANSDGRQVAKWTPRRAATPFVPIADRPYFQSVTDGWAWPKRGALPTRLGDGVFYAESIFSKTRAENLAVFSHRFALTNHWPSGNTATNPNYIPCPTMSAMTFRPLSLFSPVLPAGYGFCIIEPNGRVLFHSDANRNLRENFIAECGRSRHLQAAVYGRMEDGFDVRYLNANHHVNVKPMRGFPWTIIAFRNEQVLDSVHLNILLMAGGLFGLSLVALAIGLLIRLAVMRCRRPATLARARGWFWWLWPNHPAHQKYTRRSCLALAGCLVGGVAAVWSRSPPLLFWWLLLAGASIFAVGVLFQAVAGKAQRGLGKLDRIVMRGGGRIFCRFRPTLMPYDIYVALVLVFFAMIPALVCYKIAFLKEMESYVKATQLRVAHELQERPVQMRRRARKWVSAGALAYWENASRIRLTSDWNRYLSFFQGMSVLSDFNCPQPAQRHATWFTDLYGALHPHFTDTALPTSGLISANAADGSWQSCHEGDRLTIKLQGGDDKGDPNGMMLSSLVPGLAWPAIWPLKSDTPGHLFWYLAMLVALAAPFVFAGLIGRALLMFNLPESLRAQRVSPHIQVAGPWEEPGPEKKSTFAASESTRISIRDRPDPPGPEERWEAGTLIVVSHPDDRALHKWVDALNQPPRRSHIAVFQTASENPFKFWKLRQEHKSAVLAGNVAPASSAAVAWKLSQEYDELWNDLTPGEKLILHQVAQSGFCNSRRPELRSLLDRGLLRFGPELCLRNESFRRFVLASFDSAQVMGELQRDDQSGPLAWRSLRGPLGIGMSLGALFLFATQNQLWQLAVGLATSFATASQGLSKITDAFAKAKRNDADRG